MLTQDQLQAEIDALFAQAKRLLADGERRAADTLLQIMRRFQGYLPAPKPATAPPVPPSAAAEVPETPAASVEPEAAPMPLRRFRKPKQD